MPDPFVRQRRRLHGGRHADEREPRLQIIRVRGVLKCPRLQIKRFFGLGGLVLRISELLLGDRLFGTGQDLVKIETRLGVGILLMYQATASAMPSPMSKPIRMPINNEPAPPLPPPDFLAGPL